MKKEIKSQTKLTESKPISKGIFWVLGFAFLLFSNTLTNGYNMDDNLVTQNHPLTSKGLSATKEIFTSNYYKDAMGNTFGYRPMVHFSFALEKSLFGESAKVSHFVNMIIYLLVLFLFYKLLIRWLGKANEQFALITTLIFAIHPIHSEVVASIKNRDEMLAFLFAIAAGIFIHKFCTTKKRLILLGIALFFTLGLLSKKSIFPLVFVFPLAQLFLAKTPIKTVVFSLLALLIPSAIIVGETDLIKSLVVFFVPLLSVFLAFSVRSFMSNNELISLIWNRIKPIKELFFSIISWVFIGYGLIVKNDFFVVIGTLIIALNFSKPTYQFVQLSILTSLYAFLNKTFVPLDFTYFFAIYFLLYAKGIIKNSIIYSTLFISLMVFCSIGFNANYTWFEYIIPLNKLFLIVVFFVLFAKKNKKISWLTIVVSLIIYFILNWYVLLFALLIIIFSSKLIKINKIISLKKDISLGLVALFCLSYFAVINYQNLPLTHPKGVVEKSQKVINTTSSIIKEGRNLEYVENTLVANHSFQETIGTGMTVIGEYARLLIFPNELSFYYGFSKIQTTNMYSLGVFLIVLFYFLLLLLGSVKIKSNPIIMIGVVWFVSCILLFSNWVELVAGMVGERLAFTASAGFVILFVGIVYLIKPSFNFAKLQKMEILCLVVVISLSVRTYFRNMDWENAVVLMSKDIEHLDNSAQANNLLATALMSETQTNSYLDEPTVLAYRNKAVLHFEKAITAYPKYFNYHYDLGRTFVLMNDNKNAKNAFYNAFRLQPKNLLAIEELTKTSFDLGDFSDTVYYGKMYLKLNPINENIHELVAYMYLINKDFKNANYYAKTALKYYPSNPNLNKIIVDTQ